LGLVDETAGRKSWGENARKPSPTAENNSPFVVGSLASWLLSSAMDTIFSTKGVDADKLFDAAITWVLGPGLRIVLIILLAWVAARIGRTFIQRSLALALHRGRDPLADMQITKRRNTLTGLFVTILGVVVISMAAIMVFKELNFEIGPILASAGIVGVAVGFGAQSLVKDVIAGAFIVLEQQFGVGDVVKIGDRSGVVESLGLRTTMLRDQEGVAHIIPNGKIEMVSVMTKDWSQLVLDVDVAYDTDLDKAVGAIQKVLNQFAKEFSSDVLAEPQVLGVESFGDNSIKIRSTVKTAPSKQWDAGRIIRRRLKVELESAGIQIPFQQNAGWVRRQPSLPEAASSDAEKKVGS
jgi:moderate conductance mechanosensitive channel